MRPWSRRRVEVTGLAHFNIQAKGNTQEMLIVRIVREGQLRATLSIGQATATRVFARHTPRQSGRGSASSG